MKLETYIHELLKENETVIVPGFGAFFSEYKPAEISETEIKPPSKQISFSSNIRNNDGVLVGHVAIVEQVSHFDALKLIEKDRDNIIFLLDRGEEVSMEKIGRLTFNNKNELEFFPYHIENLTLDNFGLETVSLERLNEIQSEPEVEEVPPPLAEHLPETNEGSVSHESAILTKSTEIVDDHQAEDEVVSVTEPQQEETEENGLEEQTEVEENEYKESVNEPVFIVKDKKEPEKEEKRKSGWYWFLLILIPIVVAGIFVIKNMTEKEPGLKNSNNTEVQQYQQNEMQMEERSVVTKDSMEVTQEEVLIQDSATIILSENVSQIDSFAGQPVYYLIGGSFKESEERALAYMEELKEKGFNPFYMGKQGNFYTVGIGKYKTEGQAVRTRDTIWLKYPEWNLWVLEE